MEMIKTKLPFYILPAIPGLSFLTANVPGAARGQHNDLKNKGFKIAAIVWAIACLGLVLPPGSPPKPSTTISPSWRWKPLPSAR